MTVWHVACFMGPCYLFTAVTNGDNYMQYVLVHSTCGFIYCAVRILCVSGLKQFFWHILICFS